MAVKETIQGIEYDGVELFPLPINTFSKKLDLVDFEFYITVDKVKFFKIRSNMDAIPQMLSRYQLKGVKTVYVSEANFTVFLELP